MHEVRFHRLPQRVHSDFTGQVTAFTCIARRARGDDVGPLVASAPRLRYDMVSCQAFAQSQLPLHPVAVLAGVVIAGEEEGVGDLAAEAAGNVDEADEANDCRSRKLHSYAAYRLLAVGLDNLRLALDDE